MHFICACVCVCVCHKSVVGCPLLSLPAPANYLSLQSNAFSKKAGEKRERVCVLGCFSSVEHLENDSCQEDVRQSWIWRSSCCGQLSGENGIICHRLRNVSGHVHACAPAGTRLPGRLRLWCLTGWSTHREQVSEQRKEAAHVYVSHNQEHGLRQMVVHNAASLLLFIGGVKL